MRGKIRKTLKETTIQADHIFIDQDTFATTVQVLPPVVVIGKVTAKNAPAIVRESTHGLPADSTILIKSITESAATYEMEIADFIKTATIVNK